jgi:hypothetical protein
MDKDLRLGLIEEIGMQLAKLGRFDVSCLEVSFTLIDGDCLEMGLAKALECLGGDVYLFQEGDLRDATNALVQTI